MPGIQFQTSSMMDVILEACDMLYKSMRKQNRNTDQDELQNRMLTLVKQVGSYDPTNASSVLPPMGGGYGNAMMLAAASDSTALAADLLVTAHECWERGDMRSSLQHFATAMEQAGVADVITVVEAVAESNVPEAEAEGGDVDGGAPSPYEFHLDGEDEDDLSAPGKLNRKIAEKRASAGETAAEDEEFVQHQHPLTKLWVKQSKKTGRVVGKPHKHKHPGVPVFKRAAKSGETAAVKKPKGMSIHSIMQGYKKQLNDKTPEELNKLIGHHTRWFKHLDDGDLASDARKAMSSKSKSDKVDHIINNSDPILAEGGLSDFMHKHVKTRKAVKSGKETARARANLLSLDGSDRSRELAKVALRHV